MKRIHEQTVASFEEISLEASSTPLLDSMLDAGQTPITDAVLRDMDRRALRDRNDRKALRNIANGHKYDFEYDEKRRGRIAALYDRLDKVDRQKLDKLGLGKCTCGRVRVNPCEPVRGQS